MVVDPRELIRTGNEQKIISSLEIRVDEFLKEQYDDSGIVKVPIGKDFRKLRGIVQNDFLKSYQIAGWNYIKYVEMEVGDYIEFGYSHSKFTGSYYDRKSEILEETQLRKVI